MWKRIATLFRGFIGLFVSSVERQNPQALIEVEKENLRTQIARFNDNLATHAGFIERLMRQVKSLEQKEKELTAKVAAHLKAGNRTVAGQIALELQTVKDQAELQEMAAGMISSVGGSGDTLNRVEEYLNERRDKAAGKARVASDSIDIKEVELKEGEQAALAEQALRDFESAYGFESPAPQAEGPAPAKEMGPKESQ